MAKATKYVYFFGSGKAEGKEQQRELLGGKGAGLDQNYWTQMIQAPHKDRGAQAIRAFRRLTRLAAFGGFSTGKTVTRTLASGTEITESDSRLPQFIYHPPDLERDMEQIEILEKDAKIYVPPDWICCAYGEEFNNGDREFKVYEIWEPSETPYIIETFQSPLIKTGWRGQGYKANVVFICRLQILLVWIIPALRPVIAHKVPHK